MKLIKADTLEIREFPGVDNAPPYAILSHRWGEQECTFQIWTTSERARSKGFRKIQLCCNQALKDKYEWVWVDSCCIDKTSSAELSEAINSMWRLYSRAGVCYAFLEDVAKSKRNMAASGWFSRGWTLQELIAPSKVVFYDSLWSVIGTKVQMVDQLSMITRIRQQILKSSDVRSATMAERLSWIANRQTTRIEDMAYCLLGICEVNMPLLYGEGSKAFRRLQEEIIRTSRDYSFLLWGLPELVQAAETLSPVKSRFVSDLLAEHPKNFNFRADFARVRYWHCQPKANIIGGGVEITLPIRDCNRRRIAALPYAPVGRHDVCIGIPLQLNGDLSYSRGDELVLVKLRDSDSDLYWSAPTWYEERIIIAKPMTTSHSGTLMYESVSIRDLELSLSTKPSNNRFRLNLSKVRCLNAGDKFIKDQLGDPPDRSGIIRVGKITMDEVAAGPVANIELKCDYQSSLKDRTSTLLNQSIAVHRIVIERSATAWTSAKDFTFDMEWIRSSRERGVEVNQGPGMADEDAEAVSDTLVVTFQQGGIASRHALWLSVHTTEERDTNGQLQAFLEIRLNST